MEGVSRGRPTVKTQSSAPDGGRSFSAPTLTWQETADLAARKHHGQFMTPRFLRDRLLDNVPLFREMRVLDPGVGTGEFLRAVLDREPSARVVGWDIDGDLLTVARKLVPEASLERRSALEPYVGEPFDLVIGNPPYFQFRAPLEMRKYFAQVISGRPNIFALFFQAGLQTLADGGYLAYVVPPSMNNGAYFERLREYIVERAAIEYLEVFAQQNLFEQAQTSVQLIVLRTGELSDRHVFTRMSGDGFRRTIFSTAPHLLEASFEGRRTLYELGYEAVTGTVVWNQHRGALRQRQERDAVPLIWAHNIRDGDIALSSRPGRPQYVIVDRYVTGPAIVVNRIVGAVGAGELRCARIPDGMPFVGENHVNVVRPRRGWPQAITWSQLLDALRHPYVGERIRLLTGNTQISATELTHLIPLDA